MEKIIVKLGERSYPITIASKFLNDSKSFWPLTRGNSAMLVTNNLLAPLYLDALCDVLNRIDVKVDWVILPDGEQHKSLMALEQVFSALLAKSHGRDTTIIAFGGGVIGDIAGFVAASYQRGVRFIQIPTTLLSQVDASVGGKTGVNHPLGKNMIGAFYQPISVIIDPVYLNTLPKREFSSGLAEVIKYGIIFDAAFFAWLESHLEMLLALEPRALIYCIRRCCELKSHVVAIDEHDQNQRALLNLGHTYGHAIEAHMGYGNWLHGEAVAAGIMMAVYAARQLGMFKDKDTKRIEKLLLRAGLPVRGPEEMTPEAYLPYMMRDKKIVSGQLRLILPEVLGKARIQSHVTSDMIVTSIKNCQTRSDFARLGEDVTRVVSAGADIVHFDVMDNHYVPNLTMGPMVLKALRSYGITVPIDVHLMAKPVDRLISDFATAGADYITFHPEATEHIDRSLQLIKEFGCKTGLGFNPATSLHYLEHVIDKLDIILLMSVNPGFGGQSFLCSTLNKIRQARQIIDQNGRDIHLEVDGGVTVDNIGIIASAGANMFVTGSAIFSQPSYKMIINTMRFRLAGNHA